jgi:hypothetical protein
VSNLSPVKRTRAWVESFVIGLNLCPFAKKELVNDRIRFHATNAETENDLLIELQKELKLLQDNESIETTLLIHPSVLNDFEDYNQFLGLADDLLVTLHLEGVFQIASFHPDYQFADTHPDDAENYTNRSPFPTLHLLREESLEKAIEHYDDVSLIPARNIAKMNEMGLAKLIALLEGK